MLMHQERGVHGSKKLWCCYKWWILQGLHHKKVFALISESRRHMDGESFVEFRSRLWPWPADRCRWTVSLPPPPYVSLSTGVDQRHLVQVSYCYLPMYPMPIVVMPTLEPKIHRSFSLLCLVLGLGLGDVPNWKDLRFTAIRSSFANGFHIGIILKYKLFSHSCEMISYLIKSSLKYFS